MLTCTRKRPKKRNSVNYSRGENRRRKEKEIIQSIDNARSIRHLTSAIVDLTELERRFERRIDIRPLIS
jgi:hypothetical protein